jgi:DNA-binding HxlR family transcriptional regulator
MKTVGQAIGCVDSATEILGNKWTPLLLRFFLNEPSVRFCQLQDSVGGINPRTLCARLEQLENEGIIIKESIGDSTRCTYRLTQKGKDLMPILQSMQAWSTQYPVEKTA